MSRLDTAVKEMTRQKVSKGFTYTSYYQFHLQGYIPRENFDKFFYGYNIRQHFISDYLKEVASYA